MSRVLGKVEVAESEAPRYFIHCSTSGWSLSPLFVDSGAAWAIYDEGGSEALRKAVPAKSDAVRVVRKSLAWGRGFDADGEVMSQRFGLATDDRLLTPIDESDDDLTLLESDGQLHVAVETHGGFSGRFDVPLCDLSRDFVPAASDEPRTLDEFFGRTVALCPACVAVLRGRVR